MEFKIQPWKHQLEAIGRAETLPGFALFFEMGAGKTGTTINILRGKFNAEKRYLRTLIFCPPIVVPNWRDEWLKHSSVEPDQVVLLTGPGRRRVSLFNAHAWGEFSAAPVAPRGKNSPVAGAVALGRIFVTNYESLLMPELFDAFLRWQPEALVFDESHKCKDPKAKRSKLAARLALPEHDPKTRQVVRPAPRYKYILSGSPVLNSPMDLFQQFLILDGGRTFGQNFFAFRGRYFRDHNAGMNRQRYFPDWRLIPGKLAEINELIHRTGMRVTKAECMDLPPLVRQTIQVEMTLEQRRMYLEMKQDFLTFMGEQAVVATMALTKALRLMQIASGYVKTVEGQEISLEKTPKQEALKELLSEIAPHSKVLVWAVWRENYEQIKAVCGELGLGYVEVHGDITAAQKQENVEKFKTDPGVRVFIGHPGSGGIGINLVNAPYSIFYSRTFSLEHSLQAEARNHRGGSEIHDKITRIDLVCAGTIDELVEKKLAQKIDVSEKLLGELVRELEAQE